MIGPWMNQGYMWGGMWMMVFMMLFWLVFIGVVIYVVRWAWHRGGMPSFTGETALDVLKRRYAKGEISREEYMRMKEDIS